MNHFFFFLLIFLSGMMSANSFAVSFDYVFPENVESYQSGVRVKASDGNIYECKPLPDGENCQIWNAANDRYEPAKGSDWQQAWNKISGNIQASAASNAGFKFIVMADPQAWRHPGGGDPNNTSSRDRWTEINHRVVNSLNLLKTHAGVSFAILNGDITEFGRTKQWNSWYEVYNKLSFPIYIGLGNHDYANNVSDCYEGTTTNNACAGRSVVRMRQHMMSYALRLPNYNDDISGPNNKSRGSMAYSWDHDNLHFVQLQNYPTYSVDIKSWDKFYDHIITSSLAWLDKDLAQARARGKHIILNFHDANDHFAKTASAAEKKYFRQILSKYNVTAVFVGHLHNPALINNLPELYGTVPVYVSDALFNGGYYLVTADSQGITIDSYKEDNGKPRFIKTMGRLTFPAAPAFCKLQGEPGVPGDVYSNYFNKNHHFFLVHKKTGRNLDANAKGNVYLHDFNGGDPQKFSLMPVDNGQVSYNSFYKLTQISTGRVLDSDSKGNVYSAGWNGGHYQQWKILKTAAGHIMLTNRATGRILDASSQNEVYTSGLADISNDYQNWKLVGDQPRLTAQVYYYRLKTPNGYHHYFPPAMDPTQQYHQWEYVAEHDQSVASPCIGW